ncbi:hypothetical protein [Streptomyces litchfieldiae]|uniref:Secreted protein n=1 Tax=Streptomyces litchfieldiae TaxID=3075543 RepID=A0ABU2MLH1_9ACTN|nr:hypothetical protein [Streptomyces sp. DSM 44938]MDT0341969.1 hypothetical protein [Streptomyces sp. DSM 44938]
MGTRMRALVVGTVAVAGLALGGGVAAAAPGGEGGGFRAMDYWYLHSHYATQDECVAVGEHYTSPTGGADGYECWAADNGGWDLWLIFAT